MGGKSSKEEEIIIQQQQQQQASVPAQPIAVSSGIGPVHVIAVCAIIVVVALAARFLWRLITREIEIRTPRRTESVATIV